jgi:hypothetical protein
VFVHEAHKLADRLLASRSAVDESLGSLRLKLRTGAREP